MSPRDTSAGPGGPRLALVLAVGFAVGSALLVTWDAITRPTAAFLCNFGHPDCLGNHWLMVWVAEQVAAGRTILHNDAYYWPIGDAPWLAGNGSEGFAYLPWHLLLGWPLASNVHLALLLALNGMAVYAFARACGARALAAASLVPAGGILVYAVHELGAGRFSQVSLCWLTFFLASWLSLLRAPTVGRAALAAALLATTSLFYWYYGFFGVLAGAGLLFAVPLRRAHVRPLAVFVGATLVLIAPLLRVFLGHWSGIPGTAEDALFPHPEATNDSAWPAIPFLAAGGRHAGRALPLSVCLLAFAALFLREHRRVVLTLLGVGVLFAGLMAGTLLEPGPYTTVYGLGGPLRRFWWPYRHVVVVNLVWIGLAAIGLDALLARVRRPVAAVAVAVALGLSVPLQLELQGAPWRAQFGLVEWPEPFYAALRDRPGTILLEPPFAPEVSSAQTGVAYQMLHHKRLVGGHALWVDRVRPDAWDAWVAENSFLVALQRFERAELAEAVVRFEAADLEALIDAGAATFVLNREYFPAAMSDMVNAYEAVLSALFGPPVARGKRVLAWDTGGWSGATEVPFDAFSWPPGVRPGGPTLGVQSPRWGSLAFSAPMPPAGGREAPRKPKKVEKR